MLQYFFVIWVILATSIVIDAASIAKLQELPPLPGYIPVYIRKGDTPLEEINLQLAEAFKRLERKNIDDTNDGNLLSKLAAISTETHIQKIGKNKITREKEYTIPVIIKTDYAKTDENNRISRRSIPNQGIDFGAKQEI